MREADLREKCRVYAKRRGWLRYMLDPTGNRGALDCLYVGPDGALLFVEHKQPSGRKRAHQILEQQMLRDRGHRAEFCWTFEQFVTLID